MAKSKKQEGSKWPWIIGLGAAAGGGMLIYLTRRPSKPKDYDLEEGDVTTDEIVDESEISKGSFSLIGKAVIPPKAIDKPLLTMVSSY